MSAQPKKVNPLPTDPKPLCKCGKRSRFIQHNTFSYHYCDACKVEVEKLEEKSWKDPWTDVSKYITGGIQVHISNGVSTPLTSQGISPPPYITPVNSSLPLGYVALKGESIRCNNCGRECGTLGQDLPNFNARITLKDYADWNWHICCSAPAALILHSKVYTYNVQGRGWV
jgi:hypothetical protein